MREWANSHILDSERIPIDPDGFTMNVSPAEIVLPERELVREVEPCVKPSAAEPVRFSPAERPVGDLCGTSQRQIDTAQRQIDTAQRQINTAQRQVERAQSEIDTAPVTSS